MVLSFAATAKLLKKFANLSWYKCFPRFAKLWNNRRRRIRYVLEICAQQCCATAVATFGIYLSTQNSVHFRGFQKNWDSQDFCMREDLYVSCKMKFHKESQHVFFCVFILYRNLKWANLSTSCMYLFTICEMAEIQSKERLGLTFY